MCYDDCHRKMTCNNWIQKQVSSIRKLLQDIVYLWSALRRSVINSSSNSEIKGHRPHYNQLKCLQVYSYFTGLLTSKLNLLILNFDCICTVLRLHSIGRITYVRVDQKAFILLNYGICKYKYLYIYLYLEISS